MIEVQRHDERGTKAYKLREQVAGKRGQYTWSYHSTLGELTDPRALDLLDIGKALFLADRTFRRSDRLGSQTRRISVCVPVRSVGVWSAASTLVENIARFVSADEWNITFTRSEDTRRRRRRTSKVDVKSVVALFSGGLDSLCGAAHLYLKGVNPVFVTHSPPGSERVRQLLYDVAAKLGRSDLAPETQFVSFRLSPIERNKAGFRSMFQEPTRRTRPFFFLSLAGAVAIDKGIQTIQMSENGALAANLPVRADAYGARCARQAHAEALRQFQLLLRTVCPGGESLRVINPFENMTKGEASKLLGSARSLARKSVSCEYVGKQAATILAWKRRHKKQGAGLGTGPECGLCIPCIVRRAALKQAKIKDSNSWYFFDARRAISGYRGKSASTAAPLYKFVLPHVYFMQDFCIRLSGMSFQEFVIQYLPELRLASRDLQRFAGECQRIYNLEQRFASEIMRFLGGP
jgi:7-cyano-7-deazaguanine synthase in queuosine biosynthesis